MVSGYTGQLHIQYIRNPKNVGCGMSRQVGIDCGKSSHFCFLDSDDMFMPYTVEVFNAAIDDDPNLELLCGSFYEQAKVNGKHALILKKMDLLGVMASYTVEKKLNSSESGTDMT